MQRKREEGGSRNPPQKLEREKGRGGEGEKEFLLSITGAQPSWDTLNQS
jgi:hypothetical protein